MARLSEIGGRRLPFLRWSFIRMLLGIRKLTSDWQVGDGREEALRAYVLENARAGDLDDVIRVVDEFCYEQSFMMNVGDEKGELLDAALRRADPKLILELGTYCGYSGLRMARVMPAGARVVSVEFLEANAEIARAIWKHAGVDDRVTCVVGTLGDGGRTADALAAKHGLVPGSVDAVFIDHDKKAYLPDTKLILDRGWLHPGSVLVADNIKFPGAPEYHAFMRSAEGKTFRSVEHETHAEYQTLFKDLVLESEFLGPAGA
jgi:catechol O-methyltransferase